MTKFLLIVILMLWSTQSQVPVPACTTTCNDANTVVCIENTCFCKAGYYGNTCQDYDSSCTSGQYRNNFGCANCDPSCTECSTSDVVCLVCVTTGVAKYIAYSSVLQIDCTNNRARNTGCHSSCDGCRGYSQADCIACTDATKYHHNFQCFTTCPAGTHPNDPQKTCSACDSTCTTCSGGTSTQCLSCTAPRVLSGTTCGCQSDHYEQGGTCTACDSSCATCSGSMSTQCLSCTAPRVLSGTTCGCQSDHYEQGGTCTACDSSCATCSGSMSTQCLSCKGSITISSTNTCVCPNGQYMDAGGNCTACHASCTTCSGPQECQGAIRNGNWVYMTIGVVYGLILIGVLT